MAKRSVTGWVLDRWKWWAGRTIWGSSFDSFVYFLAPDPPSSLRVPSFYLPGLVSHLSRSLLSSSSVPLEYVPFCISPLFDFKRPASMHNYLCTTLNQDQNRPPLDKHIATLPSVDLNTFVDSIVATSFCSRFKKQFIFITSISILLPQLAVLRQVETVVYHKTPSRKHVIDDSE